MTDHDIRAKVAELLGWTNIVTWPDGVIGGDMPPPDRSLRRVPNYPSDLNAAVAAVEARGHGWQVNTYGWEKRFDAEVTRAVDKEGEGPSAEADSPARALCLALLKAEGINA